MKASLVYKLSDSPLILAGSFGAFEAAATIKRPFTYIHHNAGWIRPRNLWRYHRIARSFRAPAKILFVTNEQSEARWLNLTGLRARCVGQNLHVSEHFFVPGNENKEFDAVYAAQMAPFKRIPLAAGVKNLNVVTYQLGEAEWDLHKYAPEMSHAHFNRQFITQESVREIYQKSKVALALSAFEGAMWASCEYLLCGLPVVSTPNRGGRDRYFESWYAPTIAADSNKIAEAVAAFVANPPCGEKIRATVLSKMNADRLALLRYMEEETGVVYPDKEAELKRLWGGKGISQHAIPISDLDLMFR